MPRPGPRRRRCARLAFAGQYPLGERRPDDLADAELRAAWKNLVLRKGPKHRILRLTRHETDYTRHFCRRLDLVERPFAKANIPRLALTDGRGQSLHRFLERSFLVKAVTLIKIDVICPEPLQRSVELRDDLRAGQPSIRVAHREKNTGRQHVGCAIDAVQRLAKHALRRAAAIHVRGIDEIDPKVERLVDAGKRLALFDAARISQP